MPFRPFSTQLNPSQLAQTPPPWGLPYSPVSSLLVYVDTCAEALNTFLLMKPLITRPGMRKAGVDGLTAEAVIKEGHSS